MIERLEREINIGCNPETGCATDVVDAILEQSRDGEITYCETKRMVRAAMGAILTR